MKSINLKCISSILLSAGFLLLAFGSGESENENNEEKAVDCSNNSTYPEGYSSGSLVRMMGGISDCESYVSDLNYKTGKNQYTASECFCEGFQNGRDNEPNRYPEKETDTDTNAEYTAANTYSPTNSIDKLSINFSGLVLSFDKTLFENETQINALEKDTIHLERVLGEQIEGSRIYIGPTSWTNIKLEERMETSISVSDEGPHCDLKEWKHNYSDWKELKSTNGEYAFANYSDSETKQFPNVTIQELKDAVRLHCGEDWHKLVENINSVKDYPIAILISTYQLKITGERNGKFVAKVISINEPMGD